MTRLPLLFALAAVLSIALFAAACGDDDDDATPIQLQQQDRDQIKQMATDYLAAVQARDTTKALAQLPDGVPQATVKTAMDTWEKEGYQLISISEDMTVDGQDVLVTLTLKDKTGKDVTRTMEFRVDKGQWKLWSPQLKLPA